MEAINFFISLASCFVSVLALTNNNDNNKHKYNNINVLIKIIFYSLTYNSSYSDSFLRAIADWLSYIKTNKPMNYGNIYLENLILLSALLLCKSSQKINLWKATKPGKHLSISSQFFSHLKPFSICGKIQILGSILYKNENFMYLRITETMNFYQIFS